MSILTCVGNYIFSTLCFSLCIKYLSSSVEDMILGEIHYTFNTSIEKSKSQLFLRNSLLMSLFVFFTRVLFSKKILNIPTYIPKKTVNIQVTKCTCSYFIYIESMALMRCSRCKLVCIRCVKWQKQR